MAAAFYKLMKVLEYETANPGQDDSQEATGEKSSEADVSHRPMAGDTITSTPIPQYGNVGDPIPMEPGRVAVVQAAGER